GAVETLLRRVVPDAEDRLAHDGRDVGVRAGRHLTGDVHLTGGDQGFDRDTAARVVPDESVQDTVADLVSDLVWVAFGDRLGGEKTPCHGAPSAVQGWVCAACGRQRFARVYGAQLSACWTASRRSGSRLTSDLMWNGVVKCGGC